MAAPWQAGRSPLIDCLGSIVLGGAATSVPGPSVSVISGRPLPCWSLCADTHPAVATPPRAVTETGL